MFGSQLWFINLDKLPFGPASTILSLSIVKK
jgi:hypothetical protein